MTDTERFCQMLSMRLVRQMFPVHLQCIAAQALRHRIMRRLILAAAALCCLRLPQLRKVRLGCR
jgi:hypothetical protein